MANSTPVVLASDQSYPARVLVAAATAIGGTTGSVTNAMLSLALSRDGTSGGSVTTISVTSGKKLRITAMTVGHVLTTANVVSCQFMLRMNPSGSAGTSSQIIHIVSLSCDSATADNGRELSICFPDALEFSGTHQIGISQICDAGGYSKVWASLIGYEY
jgi:hypothetical protein